MAKRAVFVGCVGVLASLLAGCGGGGTGGGGGQQLRTPVVTVTPASATINTQQTLSVNVVLTGSTSSAAVTGTVTLKSGSYSSAATTLTSGSATIQIPAATLAPGSDTLSAAYTPDATSAAIYNSASGSGQVSVARITPTVAVTPAAVSVTTTQSLMVTVAVSAPSGDVVPTGSVVITGGGYTSSSSTLASGSASVTIAAGALAAGSDTLSASYTTDTASANIYASSSGSSPAVEVSSLTTVSVDAATPGKAVTDQLLGVNMAAWFDETQAFIVPAMQTAGIKALRWPGGSWSDEYHWQAHMMCQGTAPNLTTGGWAEPHDTYTNFISQVQNAGAFDVAITADYGTNAACNGPGDPTEAAGWVTAWDAAGGHVSHVTVGNEEYGSWETDLHAKPNDPATYAAAAQTYYADIKAADNTVLVGVDVNAANSWDSTVLTNAKGSYDFVEFHYYPQGPDGESDNYLVTKAANDLTGQIQILRNELQAAGSSVDTPIYVGEIGSVYTNPGKQSWSITQGLYAGQVLGEMMNAGVSRLTWWIGFGNCNGQSGNDGSSVYGWQGFGAYNIFSDGSDDPTCGGAGAAGTMSPTAQAFNLMQNVLVNGENVLPVTVGGDTSDVRAYAATHAGGTALVVFNLNETASESVQLTVSGGKASGTVTVITYDKGLYDQTNASTPVWATATTNNMGTQSLPLTLNLTPWSMNVVLIQ